MQKKRIAAGIIAVAVLAGSVGLAVFNKEDSALDSPSIQKAPMQVQDEAYSYAYGIVQSLYFKISELWRMSINSDMDANTVAAISLLRSGFDAELLTRAIEAEGDDIIDEYIYSVLAGLDFELYMSDRDAYEKAKSESGYTGEVLTQESIEKYFDQLNDEIAESHINDALSSVPTVEVPTPEAPTSGGASLIPETPTAESVLPQNPADAVRKETEAITNHAFGIEVE